MRLVYCYLFLHLLLAKLFSSPLLNDIIFIVYRFIVIAIFFSYFAFILCACHGSKRRNWDGKLKIALSLHHWTRSLEPPHSQLAIISRLTIFFLLASWSWIRAKVLPNIRSRIAKFSNEQSEFSTSIVNFNGFIPSILLFFNLVLHRFV